MERSQERVLVSGASGFVAGQVIQLLLSKDYLVRGTVRSTKDQKKLQPIYDILPEKRDNLELVEADLLNEASWMAACKDVDYVMHVASPFPLESPKDENELIRPAVLGTKAVLEAALANGVKKVVVTSSVAAIMDPKAPPKVFTEADWPVVDRIQPYEKSKYHAEKAVWAFYEEHKDKIQIAVVNPGFILGPPFCKSGFSSGDLIIQIMTKKLAVIPDIAFACVDVRQVAEAHYKAMILPSSNGKRHILSGGTHTVEELVGILRAEFEKYGYSFPSMKVGFCPMKLASLFDPKIKGILDYVGKRITLDNSRSVTELGIEYYKLDKTLIDMVYKLLELGLLEDKRKKK
eukprot:TRINITY_DN9734_c0_g1_i1.p1 TRINITY_DN9734_c0_g1~~TRINITY_DN9734_c0_g1_i1.p1  ORF type:complete len:347 (+),score=101.92 TRINITY_DN9734_c0_g1_i1:120-1160(+)